MKNHHLTILLVDDEAFALHLMESLLKNKSGIGAIHTAGNRKDALELAVTHQPDVIFQDIKMLDADGLDLADEYRKLHIAAEIVFVTAYEQYAISAIRKAAFDYLLKPVDNDELDDMLLRLRAKITGKNHEKPGAPARLKIPTRTGFRLIDHKEIIFCEADSNYTNIHLADGTIQITSMNLGALMDVLPAGSFFRLSRSVIVNTTMISELNKGGHQCMLKAKNREYIFPVTKSRMKQLEDMV